MFTGPLFTKNFELYRPAEIAPVVQGTAQRVLPGISREPNSKPSRAIGREDSPHESRIPSAQADEALVLPQS